MALVLAAVVLAAPPSSLSVLATAAVFLCAMTAWIAAVDRSHFLIPDGPVVAIGIVGAAARLAARNGAGDLASADIVLAAFDAILWGGCFFALREIYFRRRGADGIGLGDVKLAAACAVLNGSAGFAWALLAASAGALLTVGAASRLTAREPVDRVAFGAFLAPACCGIWIAQRMGWV